MADSGFEPMTTAFAACCTTSWANNLSMLVVSVNGHKNLTLMMCQATVVVVVMNDWLNEWLIELINELINECINEWMKDL